MHSKIYETCVLEHEIMKKKYIKKDNDIKKTDGQN